MASKVAKSVPVPPTIGQSVPPLNPAPGVFHDPGAGGDERDAGATLLAAQDEGARRLSPADFRLVRTLGTGSQSPDSSQSPDLTRD